MTDFSILRYRLTGTHAHIRQWAATTVPAGYMEISRSGGISSTPSAL
jgi:hypothetical protein